LEYGGYSEADLISNRAALLLYGGAEDDRRAWAHEASGHFASEGSLVEVRSVQQLQTALVQSKGVLFVPDVLALGMDGQRQIIRSLQEQEERPKIIVGLSKLPDEAIQQGLLREDLSYRLRVARVNLDLPGLADSIAARRQELQEKLANVKDLVETKPAKRTAGRKASEGSGGKARIKSRVAKGSRPAIREPNTAAKRASSRKRIDSKRGQRADKRAGSKRRPISKKRR
jgi:hypothetical protein